MHTVDSKAVAVGGSKLDTCLAVVRQQPDVRALLQDVRSNQSSLGVAAISITSAREAEFDFSQPIMNAGLQIMVRGQGKDGESSPLHDLMSLLFSWTSLAWLGIAGPAKMPAEVVAKLHQELKAIAAEPEYAARLRDTGLDPVASASPEQFRSWLVQQKAQWGKLIRDAKVPMTE